MWLARWITLVRPALLILVVCAMASRSSSSTAAPTSICAGCTLDAPHQATLAHSEEKLALVVVLHGDRSTAAAATTHWRAATIARGWALLGVQCPTDRGCKDSFWKWDGSPTWLLDQIHAVSAALPTGMTVDPKRIYLVGWSGGATYLGRHAQAWEDGGVAAMVFHGGGHEPYAEDCVTHLPAYFLVGDKNPLHYLIKDLRAYFDRCKQDVTWDLVAGGDHDREDRALDRKKADIILDWMASHARR